MQLTQKLVGLRYYTWSELAGDACMHGRQCVPVHTYDVRLPLGPVILSHVRTAAELY